MWFSWTGVDNGKAISALFAHEGAKVFGCDIRIEAAVETRQIVVAEGNEMEVTSCDVSTPFPVAALVANRVERADACKQNRCSGQTEAAGSPVISVPMKVMNMAIYARLDYCSVVKGGLS